MTETEKKLMAVEAKMTSIPVTIPIDNLKACLVSVVVGVACMIYATNDARPFCLESIVVGVILLLLAMCELRVIAVTVGTQVELRKVPDDVLLREVADSTRLEIDLRLNHLEYEIEDTLEALNCAQDQDEHDRATRKLEILIAARDHLDASFEGEVNKIKNEAQAILTARVSRYPA